MAEKHDWLFIGLAASAFVFLMWLVVFLATESSDFDDKCRAAGGVPVQYVCYDSSAVKVIK